MTSKSAWPVGEPSVVPGGVYVATIRGEMVEQTSKFDANRIYYTLPLDLRSQDGSEFEFVWAFGPRAPVYLRFLEIQGGTILPNGKVVPPVVQEGKPFLIKIGEQMNKEKTKTVNSVLEVWPNNRRTVKEDQEAAGPAEGSDPLDEAEHGKGDGVPF